MVNVKEITKKFDKEFLKAEHVKNAKTAKFIITTEGEIKESKYGPQLTLEGEMDEVKYKWTPNKTACRCLEHVLGEETDKWVGALVELEIGKFDTTNKDTGLPEKKDLIKIKQGDDNQFFITANTIDNDEEVVPNRQTTEHQMSEDEMEAVMRAQ